MDRFRARPGEARKTVPAEPQPANVAVEPGRAKAARAAATPRWRAGAHVAETFVVQEVLAEDASQTVLLARHEGAGMEVAVIVPGAGADRASFAERSRAWLAAGGHGNVATAYYFDASPVHPFLIVEALTGTSLDQWPVAVEACPPRIVLRYAIELCRALAHLHTLGIGHGNLHATAVRFDGDSVKLAGVDLGSRLAPGSEPTPERDLPGLGECLALMAAAGRLPLLRTLADACVQSAADHAAIDLKGIERDLCNLFQEQFGSPPPVCSPCAGVADAENNRAVLALLLNRPDEAFVAFAAARTAAPDHVLSHYNAGLAQWAAGDFDGARLARHLLDLPCADENKTEAALLAALAHLDSGQVAESISLLEGAAAGAPESAQLLPLARSGAIPPATCARVLEGHEKAVACLAMDRDGRRAVSGGDDRTLRLWDLDSGRCTHLLEGHSSRVATVVFNAGGNRVLSGGDDQTLRVWDAATGTCEQTLDIEARMIFSAALSADGRLALVAAGGDQYAGVEETRIELWDLKRGRRLCTLRGHEAAAKAVAITSDGRYGLSGSDDHSVRLWNLPHARCERIFSGHEHYVTSVCFVPGRKRIISAGWDRTVRLWDSESGRCLRTFSGHTNLVTTIDVTADGGRVVSGSWDRTVRLWDTGSGRCLRVFDGHKGLITSVRVSGDGMRVVSASWDQSVRVWPAPRSDLDFCPLRTAPRRRCLWQTALTEAVEHS